MDEPFVGEIAIFGFNFAPRNWAFCQGQILPISQNTALFSLIGTFYGGNGTTNFALPDLRGRAPVGIGQGPGLSAYSNGQMAGMESISLMNQNLPSHTHTVAATTEDGDVEVPTGAYNAGTGPWDKEYKSTTNNFDNNKKVVMNAGAVGNAGGGQPLSVMQPYLTLNYCIALAGVYPSRP